MYTWIFIYIYIYVQWIFDQAIWDQQRVCLDLKAVSTSVVDSFFRIIPHTIHWDWNIYLHLKLMFMVFMHVNIPSSHGSYRYLPIFLLGANCIFRVVEISIASTIEILTRAVAFNGQCNKRHHSAWMAQGIQWLQENLWIEITRYAYKMPIIYIYIYVVFNYMIYLCMYPGCNQHIIF